MFQGVPEFIVPKNIAEARAMQTACASKVLSMKAPLEIKTIAGVDVGLDVAANRAHASIVVLEFPSLRVIEQVQAFAPLKFPYVPGLLSFREIPAILAALSKLRVKPDVLMVDGQGIAHPKRLGIAAHLGVLLDMPSIGVAKSKLVGTYAHLGEDAGSYTLLMDKGQQIGVVLRSKNKCKPLFISPGHRMNMEDAFSITKQCFTKYRLPEPTRLADKYSKKEFMDMQLFP